MHLSRWAGLGKRSPLVAGTFAFFLIAFAGIPLTSGFTGKFAVFQAAIAGGALPLVIVGVLSSAILAFPYVRVIVLMFFSEPAPDGPPWCGPACSPVPRSPSASECWRRWSSASFPSRCSTWPTHAASQPVRPLSVAWRHVSSWMPALPAAGIRAAGRVRRAALR